MMIGTLWITCQAYNEMFSYRDINFNICVSVIQCKLLKMANSVVNADQYQKQLELESESSLLLTRAKNCWQ